MTDHYERSVDLIEAVESARAELQDLHDMPMEVRSPRDVARLNAQIGDYLKLAEIHATLSVAQGLTDVYHAIVGSRLP